MNRFSFAGRRKEEAEQSQSPSGRLANLTIGLFARRKVLKDFQAADVALATEVVANKFLSQNEVRTVEEFRLEAREVEEALDSSVPVFKRAGLVSQVRDNTRIAKRMNKTSIRVRTADGPIAERLAELREREAKDLANEPLAEASIKGDTKPIPPRGRSASFSEPHRSSESRQAEQQSVNEKTFVDSLLDRAIWDSAKASPSGWITQERQVALEASVNDFIDWIASVNCQSRVFWHWDNNDEGPDDLGYFLAKQFDKHCALASAFFFPGKPLAALSYREIAAGFATTFAAEFSRHLPSVDAALIEILNSRKHFVFKRTIRAQVNELVIEGYKRWSHSDRQRPLFVIISGLDKCPQLLGDQIMETIVSCSETLPIAFFVSSRRVPWVSLRFSRWPLRAATREWTRMDPLRGGTEDPTVTGEPEPTTGSEEQSTTEKLDPMPTEEKAAATEP
ncbi:hypothetical protein DFP72DRAFT_1137447 [Ephemerocybe angulata]|uniref:Uncharacterized protein n=1 Tax=Ephemerocybe angulata TaxID=980116 RepID=A0A8H6M1X8_9AGAR|nr:hypothetical protein DFP72DRAFT_1137447 [Tulosesus angulatus]